MMFDCGDVKMTRWFVSSFHRDDSPVGLRLGIRVRQCRTIVESAYLLYMTFEFDPAKSDSNARKHGIDFEATQVLWDDPDLLEVPARSVDESRFLVVGMIGEKHWSAVTTYRYERTRIISVRRSRDTEIAFYEGKGL